MTGPREEYRIGRRALLRQAVGLGALTVLTAPSCVSTTPAPDRAAVIGVLGDPGPRVEALRAGLRERGWVDGVSMHIVQRDQAGDPRRLPGLAAELLALGARLIVVDGAAAARAVMDRDPAVPIVWAALLDPVTLGFAASLARPEGMVTGATGAGTELFAKRVEVLSEVAPTAKRLALFSNLTNANDVASAKFVGVGAEQAGLQLRVLDVHTAPEIEPAFDDAREWGADALFIFTSSPMAQSRDRVLSLAARSRLPAMYPGVEWVKHGALMAYGSNRAEVFRRAAGHVDRILRGARPADLPIERTSVFELVVNRRTLAEIGLAIPPSALALVTEWLD